MFNLGFSEMIVLGIIALLVLGPKQLPEMARVVGRLINEFKRATGDLGSSFTSVRRETDQTFAEMQRELHLSLEKATKLEEFKIEEFKEDPTFHSDDEANSEQLELNLTPKKPNQDD